MSDDKLPENQEAGMPRGIAGSKPAGSLENPPAGTGEGPTGGPGKKKRRWIYYVVAAVVVLAGVVAYLYFGGCLRGSGGADNTAGELAQAARYTCGMHPFIITDKPGDCPICGMKLTKIEGTPAPGGATAASPAPAAKPSGGARKILFYRNPMNPNVTSKSPAKDEMGMDFVPVYEDEAKGSGGAAICPRGTPPFRWAWRGPSWPGYRALRRYARRSVVRSVPWGSSCPMNGASAASRRRSTAGSKSSTPTSPGNW